MVTIEMTVGQASSFVSATGGAAVKRLKALAKTKAYKLKAPVALSHKGRTFYVAHPNGKTTCGGCGTCKRCVASQGRAEEQAVD